MTAYQSRVRDLLLLASHGDPPAFFGGDEVVVVVGADVELHPVDRAGEAGCPRRCSRRSPVMPVSEPRSQVSSAEKIIGTVA